MDRPAHGGVEWVRDSHLLWTALATLWFGALAVVANVVFLDAFSPASLTPQATVATLLVTPPAWYLGVERHADRFVLRGVVVGLFVGVAVVPLTLLVLMVWATPVAALASLPIILLFGLIGLLLVGWLSILVGALAGGSLGAVRNATVANDGTPTPETREE